VYFRSDEVHVLLHSSANVRETCMRRAEFNVIGRMIVECRRLRAEIRLLAISELTRCDNGWRRHRSVNSRRLRCNAGGGGGWCMATS
jgi:hypothetical protein